MSLQKKETARSLDGFRVLVSFRARGCPDKDARTRIEQWTSSPQEPPLRTLLTRDVLLPRTTFQQTISIPPSSILPLPTRRPIMEKQPHLFGKPRSNLTLSVIASTLKIRTLEHPSHLACSQAPYSNYHSSQTYLVSQPTFNTPYPQNPRPIFTGRKRLRSPLSPPSQDPSPLRLQARGSGLVYSG